MDGKAMNYREAHRFLLDLGFLIDRTNGDHVIYKNGSKMVNITRTRLSQKTWKRECKKAGILC